MTYSALDDIVKTYDVRGLVTNQLTPSVARALGAAFVEEVSLPGNAVIVGHDMRDSSPVLAKAFGEGVRSRGGHIRNIGLCSTDMVYYASGTWGLPAVMITASHNPATYNGFKFSRAGAQGISLDTGLARIRDRAVRFEDGSEDYGTGNGDESSSDVLADYAAYLRQLVPVTGDRPLKVVVDAANGMAGHTVPAVFGTGVEGIEIIPLYFELDGSFPNHEANPLDAKNLVDLQRAVVAEGADVGLAFDGDADRCFVIDEQGDPVTPSIVAALVAQREVARVRDAGEPEPIYVLHNLLCSKRVEEVIAGAGAVAVRTKVGHSLIKDEMKATGAIFGGEHSAHYYFRDFWGADNGILAALHVLAELRGSHGPLSALTKEFALYAESGEINTEVTDQLAAMRAVEELFSGRGEVDHLDGVTITSGSDDWWWVNVRASNTEPLLRLNVEAKRRAIMEEVRDQALSVITTHAQ